MESKKTRVQTPFGIEKKPIKAFGKIKKGWVQNQYVNRSRRGKTFSHLNEREGFTMEAQKTLSY